MHQVGVDESPSALFQVEQPARHFGCNRSVQADIPMVVPDRGQLDAINRHTQGDVCIGAVSTTKISRTVNAATHPLSGRMDARWPSRKSKRASSQALRADM